MKRAPRMKAALVFVACCAGVDAQSSLDVGGGLDRQLDTYLTAIAKQQWEGRAAKIAALPTPPEGEARQRYIRKQLVEEVGSFPEKTPLNPRITGTLDRGEYKVE